MRVLITLGLIFASIGVFAQINPIPNAGFEDWAGTPETPDGWGVINFSIPFVIDIVTAKKTTDKYSGTYAMELESVSATLITLPGAASTGAFNPLTFLTGGGFPFDQKPLVLKGWYKYQPSGGDTATITVMLTKWNTSSNTRDTLGGGLKFFRNAVSTYTQFTVPLLYNFLETPDTAAIAIYSSSLLNPVIGSKFFVDELEFYPVSGTSVNEIGAPKDETRTFPNPSSSSISIDLSKTKDAGTIIVFDILGKEIAKSSVNESGNKINVSGFNSGLYFFQIINKSNQVIDSGKFSVN